MKAPARIGLTGAGSIVKKSKGAYKLVEVGRETVVGRRELVAELSRSPQGCHPSTSNIERFNATLREG